MKMIIKVTLLTLFFFITSTTYAISPPIVDLHQLTSSGYREDWPMIYKESVYWSDGFGAVRGYDFKTKQELLLANVGDQLPNDFFAPISYDGHNLIYNTYSEAKGYNVRAYDMKRHIDIAITDVVGSNTATDYDQNTVVYIEGGACGKLHAYDLNKKENTVITETACGVLQKYQAILSFGHMQP